MSIESERDLLGLSRAGKAVAQALQAMKARLRPGITIEPIITSGCGRIYDDPDGWTVRTADRHPAAHHEHTGVITRGRPILLTAA